METGKLRINSAVRVLVAQAELVIVQVVAREPEIAPVVGLVLAIDLAAAELEHDPAVAELEHDLVAAELEHDLAVAEQEIVLVVAEQGIVLGVAEQGIAPVVAELEPGHPPAHLAVLLRTKSVIAAHRRGLVPVLAAEDLAGAVETTREPAAVEGVAAWEAVDIVAVAEVVVAAVE
jgi:hypothetical protein